MLTYYNVNCHSKKYNSNVNSCSCLLFTRSEIVNHIFPALWRQWKDVHLRQGIKYCLIHLHKTIKSMFSFIKFKQFTTNICEQYVFRGFCFCIKLHLWVSVCVCTLSQYVYLNDAVSATLIHTACTLYNILDLELWKHPDAVHAWMDEDVVLWELRSSEECKVMSLNSFCCTYNTDTIWCMSTCLILKNLSDIVMKKVQATATSVFSIVIISAALNSLWCIERSWVRKNVFIALSGTLFHLPAVPCSVGEKKHHPVFHNDFKQITNKHWCTTYRADLWFLMIWSALLDLNFCSKLHTLRSLGGPRWNIMCSEERDE